MSTYSSLAQGEQYSIPGEYEDDDGVGGRVVTARLRVGWNNLTFLSWGLGSYLDYENTAEPFNAT